VRSRRADVRFQPKANLKSGLRQEKSCKITGMKGSVLFSCCIWASALVTAQPAAVLLEACNAVQDSTIRLECLKAAVGEVKRKAPHDALSRAFIGFQGSLASGMSLLSYQAGVQELARELAIYRSEAPPEAAAGLAMLHSALETYSDASAFWNASITFYARRDSSFAYPGGLPMQMVGLEWMLRKYDLPVRKSDIWGVNGGVPTDAGRQALWTHARAESERGFALLANPPQATGADTKFVGPGTDALIDAGAKNGK
jgi:hypothetical protein